jgi:hypothetical protein
MTYDEFRTGLTFGVVSAGLHAEAQQHFWATGERRFITRRTVLGRWHQIKRASWNAYLQRRGSDAVHGT